MIVRTDEQYRSKSECHKRAVRARLLIEQAERMLRDANGEVIGAVGHRCDTNANIERATEAVTALLRGVDFLIRDTAP